MAEFENSGQRAIDLSVTIANVISAAIKADAKLTPTEVAQALAINAGTNIVEVEGANPLTVPTVQRLLRLGNYYTILSLVQFVPERCSEELKAYVEYELRELLDVSPEGNA